MVYIIQVCWQLVSRSKCSCSQAVSKPVWHIPLPCVQWKTPDDGQRNCPKHVEFHSKNKFEKLVHLVGFILRNLSRCTVTWMSYSADYILSTECIYVLYDWQKKKNLYFPKEYAVTGLCNEHAVWGSRALCTWKIFYQPGQPVTRVLRKSATKQTRSSTTSALCGRWQSWH